MQLLVDITSMRRIKKKYDLIEEQEEREIEINNKDLSDRIFDTFKKKDKK